MAQTINVANIKIDLQLSGTDFARNEINTITKVLRETESPLDKFHAQMLTFDKALKAGAISAEQFAQAEEHLAKKFGVLTYKMEEKIQAEKKLADEAKKAAEAERQLSEQAARLGSILTASMTPVQKMAKDVQFLDQQFKAGKLDANQYNQAIDHLAKKHGLEANYADRARVAQDNLNKMIRQATSVTSENTIAKQANTRTGGDAITSIRNMAMAYVGLNAAMQGARSSIRIAAEMEQSKVAFTVMTGSAEQATKMLQDFRELDVQSPINFADFARAGKTMLQFGVSAEAIRPTLDRLSAVSLGNSERFQSLALAFGQVQANGRLMGQEVLQFVNAGFNPLQEISRTTGISMVELKKRMEDGGISAQMVAKAFETATTEGGRFAGMNQQLEATMAGQFAKLDSEIKSASITLGNSMIPLVRELTGLLKDFAAGANTEEKSIGGAFAFNAKLISEGYGFIVAALRGRGGEYLDALDDMKEAELDAAAAAMRASKEKSDAKAKENEQAKQMAMEAAQRAQAEKTRLAEMEKTIALNKEVGQSMWSLREEFDKLTLGEQAAIEAKQRHQKWAENDITMYKKLKDQVEQARKAKEMEAEASKLKEELQTPQEKLGKELQRLEALKAMGPDKGINQQQFDALSMRAAERFSSKEDIAKNIAPAIKAGTKEAYQFLQRENAQAKEKAEQKKMQEELLKEARKANELAQNAPRLALAR